MRAVGAVLLLMALAGPAMAGDEPDIDCDNAMAQQEMNYCAGKDYEEADAELNAVWAEVVAAARDSDIELKSFGDDGRPGYEDTVRAAQRAWIGYRDSWCDYMGYEARGGSMEPMLIAGCLAGLTRARTIELRNSLEGLGN